MKYRYKLKKHQDKEIIIEIDGRCRHIHFYFDKEYGLTMKCAEMLKPEMIDRLYDENKAELEELERKGLENENNYVQLNPNNEFWTPKAIIKLVAWDKENIDVKNDPLGVMVMHPRAMPTTDLRLQRVLRKVIDMELGLEAEAELPLRTAKIAAEMKIEYRKVTVRNNKSNWGSCSSDRNISLNIHLMRLPDRLIDMVIKHELCHIKHMNHSKAFYDELNKHCGGKLAELDNEIKKYHPHLYVSSFDRQE